MAAAARRSGRAPEDVLLVAVVKTMPPERVLEALDQGLTVLAENRVQEAEQKIEAVGRDRAEWHLIGHLQRNKAGKAVPLFDRIHSVDGVELAKVLSRRAVEASRVVPVMVQVNVSGESAKHGVAPRDLEPVLEAVAELPGLLLDGLMSIGALGALGDDARRYFAQTRELRDRAVRSLGVSLPHLSMGMSGDYEVAIEEGSTMVRLGTALFGPRR